MKLAIFYGSTMGHTEKVANKLGNMLNVPVFNICDVTTETFADYDGYILGTPTWGYGDIQDDWGDFIEMHESPDLTGKKVALFGLGDQDDHYDVFISGLGILYDLAQSWGGQIIGQWPTDGYRYGPATQAVREGKFVGLAIDEINQPALTEPRLIAWIEQIQKEF